MEQDYKLKVLAQLDIGANNALKGKFIARNLGEKDTRNFRLAIIELIKDGHAIVSNENGYFIAESLDEIESAISYLRKYVSSFFYRYKLLKLARKNFTGQLKLC